MQDLQVSCAIIVHKGKILIAQRRPGDSFGGYWEFPGGKCETNESMEQCLVREVMEELGVKIFPRKFICKTEHLYPEKKITLHFYLCDWVDGKPARHECLDFRWIFPEELRKYRFPQGDDDVITELLRLRVYYFGKPYAETS